MLPDKPTDGTEIATTLLPEQVKPFHKGEHGFVEVTPAVVQDHPE